MPETRYPGAKWLGNGRHYGSFTGGPWKVVLHTTETSGLPGYAGGDSAPHFTYDPKTREWVQHVDLSSSAGAMRDEAGGIRTNRDQAIQVEIICYSDKRIADGSSSRLWVGELSDEAYEDLANFVKWAAEEYGVEIACRMPRPPAKYGVTSSSRMSASEWDSFGGICGHFEVPENTHWDPGALSFERIISLAQEKVIMAAFKDVAPGHTFYNDIEAMAAAGVARGDASGNFYPEAAVTRGQLCAFLVRMAAAQKAGKL